MPTLPPGFTAITPHLVIRDAAKAIDFYKRAFGAQEVLRMPMPDSDRLMHAQLSIDGATLMLADEMPQWNVKSPQTLGGTPVTIHLQVENCDATYRQALAAGATSIMPPNDAFWGDRYAKIADPFGHHWSIAHERVSMTHEQMQAAGLEAMKNMA